MTNDKKHHHHHHHYYDQAGQRDGYAYRAGEPGPGPNPFQIRRDMKDHKIAGVCSGIAKYFGWNTGWLRIGWILATLITFPFPVFAYVAAAIFIKPAHERVKYENPEDERFWRDFSRQPRATFSELKHRFRALDARIGDMEYEVTSSERGLHKAFSDLEKSP